MINQRQCFFRGVQYNDQFRPFHHNCSSLSGFEVPLSPRQPIYGAVDRSETWLREVISTAERAPSAAAAAAAAAAQAALRKDAQQCRGRDGEQERGQGEAREGARVANAQALPRAHLSSSCRLPSLKLRSGHCLWDVTRRSAGESAPVPRGALRPALSPQPKT